MSSKEVKPRILGSKQRILLIKPRWLSSELLAAEYRELRQQDPEAHIYALAESFKAPSGLELIAPPQLVSGGSLTRLAAFLRTARQLRRWRFDEVRVVMEAHRGEAGYLEAKLWAFVARSGLRRMGQARSLSLSEELRDKWQRAAPLPVARVLLWLTSLFPVVRRRKQASSESVEHRVSRLEAFVYLQQLQSIGRPSGRRYLEVGEARLTEAVRSFGWETQQSKLAHEYGSAPTRPDGLPEAFDLITIACSKPPHEKVEAKSVKRLLNSRGLCLWQFASNGEFEAALQQVGLKVLQQGDSLFAPGCRDVWLSHEDSH
jgi:hypothetical protein